MAIVKRLLVKDETETTTAEIDSSGNVTATSFTGDGSGLTNITAAQVGALATTGGTVSGAVIFESDIYIYGVISGDTFIDGGLEVVDSGFLLGSRGASSGDGTITVADIDNFKFIEIVVGYGGAPGKRLATSTKVPAIYYTYTSDTVKSGSSVLYAQPAGLTLAKVEVYRNNANGTQLYVDFNGSGTYDTVYIYGWKY